METTFVRKDFYIQPPAKDAPPEEWAEWLKKDTRKAAAHKAAYTKSLEHADIPEEFQASTMRKVGGVWRQSTAIGFVGDVEDDTCSAEPMVEAGQDRKVILSDMETTRNKRGGTRKGKSARRHKNKKRRKGGK